MELVIVPWAAYREKLMAVLDDAQASHQAVFVPGHIWLPELAEAGYLAPIDPLMHALSPETIAAYDPDDIVPQIASECQYAGRQYQLPFFTDGHLLFYRPDVVDLDANKGVPVVSVFDLPRYAHDAHRPPKHYGMALKADASEIFTDFLPYLWEARGVLFDAEGRPDFAHKVTVEALEFYASLRTLCPPDTDQYGNSEIAQSLRDAEAALVMNWGGQTAPLFLDPLLSVRETYRVAVPSVPWNATWGIALPANQPHDIQEHTLGLLMQILNTEQDRAITRLAGSPVRTSSYAPDQLRRYPWLEAQYIMLQRARLLPKTPRLGQYLDLLYDAVYRAFTEQTSAKEALEEAQTIALARTR
jgi:multiple sugar transport system substrate-binding protein